MSPRAPQGRDQLIRSALALIAERGAKAATVRAVAEHAGVTPGLVVHHFGTKKRLAAEVERVVLERFEAALAASNDQASPTDAAHTISQRLSQTIGPDPALRHYLRRALLEPSPAGPTILRRLVDLTITSLRRFPDEIILPDGTDLDWLALQVVVINLAATLLEPVLEPVLGRDPFTPDEVERRTAANLRFLTNALANRHLVGQQGDDAPASTQRDPPHDDARFRR